MPKPPLCHTKNHTLKYHADQINDPYFWLREKENPETKKYLDAENKYCTKIMTDTKKLQQKLYIEMRKTIKEDDISVPIKNSNWFYYTKYKKGKNYQILCRKNIKAKSKEEIILDCNQLAKNFKYFELTNHSTSPDQNILAYAIDTDGSEKQTIFFKNLKTGKTLSHSIKNCSGSMGWALDNQHFFYIKLNHLQKPDRAYLHNLKSPQKDKLIYHEKDQRFGLRTWLSKDQTTNFIKTYGVNTSEIFFIPSSSPGQKLKLLQKRIPNHEYTAESHNQNLIIRSNFKSPNFKIYITAKKNPSIKNWETFIPENKNQYLSDYEIFQNHIAWEYLENGLNSIKVKNFKTNHTQLIKMPESAYTLYLNHNPDFNSNHLIYTYNSPSTPSSTYFYNFKNSKSTLKKQQKIPSGHNPKNFKVERIFAPGHDGIKIPITLVYKKSLKKNGQNPLLLKGYGSYGSIYYPSFDRNGLSLLKRGFIIGIAHIRGGKDLGEKWYQNGKLLKKKNTFKDFISCSEFLIKQKYTSAKKLCAVGGSAGGLLMGAVLNMAPNLFNSVIAHVPFVDVLNTMWDETLPLTAGEFNEWGNPKLSKFYKYIKSYSPYDNIKKQNYPNILLTAGFNDPRVTYWEPAKFCAKLRVNKTDQNLLLFKTNFGGGHFGKSGRFDYLKEKAFEYAFLLKNLKI